MYRRLIILLRKRKMDVLVKKHFVLRCTASVFLPPRNAERIVPVFHAKIPTSFKRISTPRKLVSKRAEFAIVVYRKKDATVKNLTV